MKQLRANRIQLRPREALGALSELSIKGIPEEKDRIDRHPDSDITLVHKFSLELPGSRTYLRFFSSDDGDAEQISSRINEYRAKLDTTKIPVWELEVGFWMKSDFTTEIVVSAFQEKYHYNRMGNYFAHLVPSGDVNEIIQRAYNLNIVLNQLQDIDDMTTASDAHEIILRLKEAVGKVREENQFIDELANGIERSIVPFQRIITQTISIIRGDIGTMQAMDGLCDRMDVSSERRPTLFDL